MAYRIGLELKNHEGNMGVPSGAPSDIIKVTLCIVVPEALHRPCAQCIALVQGEVWTDMADGTARSLSMLPLLGGCLHSTGC